MSKDKGEEEKVKNVEVSKIKVDENLFIRENYDRDAIERYKERYESGYTEPLILQKGTNILIDGFHRLKALRELGRDTTPVKKMDIPDDELRAEAIRRNVDAKVPLSRYERNQQIAKLYEEDGKTQKEIGELFSLTKGRISQILKSLGCLVTKHSKEKTKGKGEEKVDKRKKVDREWVIQTWLDTDKTKTKIAEESQEVFKKGVTLSRVSQITTDFKEELYDWYVSGLTKGEILEKVNVELDRKKLEEILLGFQLPEQYVEKPKVIEGDFFEVSKSLPDESVDLIVADPPYNISDPKKVTMQGQRVVELDIAEWDKKDRKDYLDFIEKTLEEFKRLLKAHGSFYMFIDRAFVSHLWDLTESAGMKPKNILVWRKTNPVPHIRKTNYLSATEFIVWGVKGKEYLQNFNFSVNNKMHNIIESPLVSGENRYDHPTQKPVKVIEKFIKVSSQQGDLVLDPFAGTGTTAVACRNLDRNWILIEKEEEYVNMIEGRLENGI